MGCGAVYKRQGKNAYVIDPYSIPETEKRGITMTQLEDVFQVIGKNCSVAEGWVETNPQSARHGKSLATKEVNLYHVNHYHIKPTTEPCKCSFVEYIAKGPQDPSWFTSHWWGEPVSQFLLCLRQHAKLRELPPDSAYWVWAYANNQHNAPGETGVDPAQSAFRKAMRQCKGTLSIMDVGGVTFSRIWCCYEMFCTLEGKVERLYDIATALPSSETAVVLTDGLTKQDGEVGRTAQWKHCGGPFGVKLQREKEFPVDVLRKAFEVKLETGETTQPEDRRRILNAMAGRLVEELDTMTPMLSHMKYVEANIALRWWLGMEALLAASHQEELKQHVLQLPAPAAWSKFCRQKYRSMYDAFYSLGNYELALGMQWRNLETEKARLGEQHRDVGVSYGNIGALYEKLGQLDMALENEQKSLDITKETLGERNTEVATAYNNIGLVYFKQGEYELALEKHQHSLDIRKELLGDRHAHVARSYNNIGMVYKQLGKYELALENYQLSLEIKKEALGEQHPDVATSYNNLGCVHEALDNLAEALHCFELSLAIRASTLGEKHPDTLQVQDAVQGMRSRLTKG